MIDWEQLARTLGTVDPEEGVAEARVSTEHGSSILARRALEHVVDSADWVSAVDHYVARLSGSELVRSVLWLVHPWTAMQRCYQIVNTSADAEARRCAVELLRVVADERVLPFTRQLLEDRDPVVQVWTAKMVEQLLSSGLIELSQCEDLLDAMKHHVNTEVRRTYAIVRAAEDDEDPETSG